MFNFFSEIKNKYCSAVGKINTYQIVLMGDYLMYVEGSILLLTLLPDSIVFKANTDIITVSGQNLTLKNLSKNTLVISGKINSWVKV